MHVCTILCRVEAGFHEVNHIASPEILAVVSCSKPRVVESTHCMQVDVEKLDVEKAYIQITHVEPYFGPEEETERRTQFERENNVCSFVYDTPFTKDGKMHGTVTVTSESMV